MLENRTSPAAANEPGLFEYLEIILKRKKMIVAVTISAFIISLVASILSSPIYQSTAIILPPQQDQGLMGLMMGGGGGALSGLAGGMLGKANPVDQYASILVSERIRDVVIDRFNLMEEYKVDYRLQMYKKMDKIVNIKAGKKDGIITISAENKDPKKAADIANAHIEELDKLMSGISMAGAGQNHGFLEGRLTRAKVELTRAEEALNRFQSKNKAISVPDQARASIEGVALLKAQLAVQETQLSALRSQFTDSAQEVKVIKATISTLNSQIARLEGVGISSIPSVGSVPDLGQEQVRLMREFKIQETLVELLTKQNEIAKLAEAKNIGNIQIIQKAKAADHHFKLGFRKRHVLMLTFFVFASAVCLVLFQDYKQKMPTEEVIRWNRIASLLKGK
ncbi:MAG: GumC family protein [Desulfuromonadaceae bacterium]